MPTVAPPRTPTPRRDYPVRLTPTGTKLFVVRWFRPDNRGDVVHRYYRHHRHAEQLVARLEVRGISGARIFSTSTDWRPTR